MIPNKSNFKFEELTPITGVKPYVIRFWETEFTEIAPLTSDSGQKIYSRNDVEVILQVKKLLFEDKMTIPEAKVKIKTLSPAGVQEASSAGVSESKVEEAKNILLHALDFVRDIKFRRKW